MKIKNRICFVGNPQDIKNVLNFMRSEKSIIDFSKIEPMGKENEKVALDDYMNLCINVYMEKHPQEREKIHKAVEFVGTTREIPYEFKLLDKKDLCSAKAKYQTSKLEDDAIKFINEIKSKAIFNGYIIRDTFWGVGCGAYMPKVKENCIEFITFDKAPIKLFEKLSQKYSNIRIDYTYKIDNTDKITELTIKNGKVYVIKDSKIEEPNIYKLISEYIAI